MRYFDDDFEGGARKRQEHKKDEQRHKREQANRLAHYAKMQADLDREAAWGRQMELPFFSFNR